MVVKPRLRGRAHLVRFADDGVLVFAQEDDARRVGDVRPKRFRKYGLQLHPEKTRLFEFRPSQRRPQKDSGSSTRPSFDFLGFTHFWATSRKGNRVLRRKTAKSRVSRTFHGNRLGRRIRSVTSSGESRTGRHQPGTVVRGVRTPRGVTGLPDSSSPENAAPTASPMD